MKERNKWLLGAIGIFVILSSFFMFAVDRTVWFDEGFSLETVQRMHDTGVNFAEHDVHPPLYYDVLYAWMLVPHGGFERFWGRFLSMLFGIAALTFIALFVEELGLDPKKYGKVLLLLATSTTLIYYGGEMRMYIMVVALAAFAMYALLKWIHTRGFWWAAGWVAALWLLPVTHYFAVFLFAPFIVLQFIWLKAATDTKHALKVGVITGGVMILSTLRAFLFYALPQINRVEQMYLPPPTLLSYLSSMFFSMHFTAENIQGWWGLALFLGFAATLVTVMWLAFRKLKEGADDAEKAVIVMLLAGALLPLLGFLGGIFQTYHHRYFLCIMWMFAFAFYFLLVDRWGKKAFAVLMLFNLVMFGVLASTPDLEMREVTKWFANETNCTKVDLVHETAWTYVVAEVYKREWCTSKGLPGWDDWLSTRATEAQGRSSGEDAINSSRIIRTDGYVSFKSDRPFYYLNVRQANGTRWSPASTRVVWSGDVANLTYVPGSKY